MVQAVVVTKAESLNRRNLDSRHLRRRGIIIRKLEYTIDRDTTYGRVSRHLRSFLYNLFPEFIFSFFPTSLTKEGVNTKRQIEQEAYEQESARKAER